MIISPNVILHPEHISNIRPEGHPYRLFQYLQLNNNLYILARVVNTRLDIICSVFITEDDTEVASKLTIAALYRSGAISFPLVTFNTTTL